MERRLAERRPSSGRERAGNTSGSTDGFYRKAHWAVDVYLRQSPSAAWSRQPRECEQCGALRWESACRCPSRFVPSSTLGGRLGFLPAMDPGVAERVVTRRVQPPRPSWMPSRWIADEDDPGAAILRAEIKRQQLERMALLERAALEAAQQERPRCVRAHCDNALEPDKHGGQWCDPCRAEARQRARDKQSERRRLRVDWPHLYPQSADKPTPAQMLLDLQVECRLALFDQDDRQIFLGPVCQTPRQAKRQLSHLPKAVRHWERWSVQRIATQ